MSQIITFKITGIKPLLMQGDALADPLNPITKAHKAVTAKKQKTQEDYEWLAESEWRAGLYFDDELGPYIPSFNLEAAITEGARLSKKGKDIERGLEVITDRARLEYEGPRTIKGLWDARFYDVRSVVVGGKRVMRYRPKFNAWSAQFDVAIDTEILDDHRVIAYVETAGRYCGLGTYRKKFGRFSVEVLS